jgi:predicted Zn-dependent protease
VSQTFTGAWLTVTLFGSGLLAGLFGGDSSDCQESPAAGNRILQTIVREWPLRYAADPVRSYVAALGTSLARAADPLNGGSRGEWRFFVVRNLEPTAFALGGRKFIVSDGLIAFVRGESDLAAVLAHEIAHQRLGHFCRGASNESQRVHHGSIVQHFDLDMEIAADAEAASLLRAAGFDSASMYHVLRCLSERPGAPTAQLEARMRALEWTVRGANQSPNGASAEFERIRALVQDSAVSPISRCR